MTINKRKTYLFLAGVILSLVGFYIGMMPVEYLNQFIAKSDINIEVTSEMRGMGGTLLIFGLFIISGAFFKQTENTSLVISALIFTSFSVFRILGLFVDGLPDQSIFIALLIELIFAFAALPLLVKQKLTNNLAPH